MNDFGVPLLLGLCWGLFLGALYLSGLWATVRLLPRRRRPKTWLAASFFIRLAVVLAGIRYALNRDPVFFMATLAAFFMARFAMLRLMGQAKIEVRRADQP